MHKHGLFWVGFFVAAIIVLPLIFGMIKLSEFPHAVTERFVFFTIFFITFFGAALLILGNRLVDRWAGKSEVLTNDLAKLGSNIVGRLRVGDIDNLEPDLSDLLKRLLASYAFINLYRWVTNLILAILVALAALLGTVLLIEQNQKIDFQNLQIQTQNAISKLNLHQEIRRQIDAAAVPYEIVSKRSINSHGDFGNLVSSELFLPILYTRRGRCIMEPVQKTILGLAARPTVTAISNLANSDEIGSDVVESLQALLLDHEGHIAGTALVILENIGVYPAEDVIEIRNTYMTNYEVASDVHIRFTNSYLHNIACKRCTVSAIASVVSFLDRVNDLNVDFSYISKLGILEDSNKNGRPSILSPRGDDAY